MPSSSLSLDPIGTATDAGTGLVWMMALVGQGWIGRAPQGEPIRISWGEATGSFGRARCIPANSLDCNWNAVDSDSKDKHGSAGGILSGSENVSRLFASQKVYFAGFFAGFDDWRLPTIEEM